MYQTLKNVSNSKKMYQTRQEIAVWYVLPAIRREFTKCFLEQGLKQKEAAKLLRVTESAVSQYLKSKRAQEVEFTEEIKAEIKKSANKIMQNKMCVVGEVQAILDFIEKSKFIFKIHKKYNEVCAICKSI